MQRLFAISLLCLTPTLYAQAAAQADLTRHMKAGQWEMSYERHATIKALGHDKVTRGTSLVCIGDSPRQDVLGWFAAKQCTLTKEQLSGKKWRLDAACKVKWADKPLPLQVEFSLKDGSSFTMDVRSNPKDKLLSYQERTVARLIGTQCTKNR